MKEIGVAQRYARALFLAVGETKGVSLPETQKELQSMLQLFRTEDRLRETLLHALLSPEQKKAALEKSLQAKSMRFSPIVLRFLNLLLQKKRMDLFPLIVTGFERAVDESVGRIKAFVKSASVLDEASKKEIEKKLSRIFNKEIFVETAVDPALIAGMVVKAGDTVIDNSLKSQLKNMKSRFENGY